jgi:hypothetical protein
MARRALEVLINLGKWATGNIKKTTKEKAKKGTSEPTPSLEKVIIDEMRRYFIKLFWALNLF